LVALDRDHPGFRDPVYRQRRNEIARQALGHRDGDPPPTIEYTSDERRVWQTVWAGLAPLHARHACRAYHDAAALLPIDRARVPQLAEINAALAPLTGFRMAPVAGLVTPLAFMRELARGVFLSTQYMRHHDTPLYTPEPDVVHELLGHAVALAHVPFATLNRRFGEAALIASDEGVEALIRAYWYTLEFGVVREDGGPRAYGAGLLSSFGELGRFAERATLRPLDLDEVARTTFDPTNYQDVLFVAPGFDAMVEAVTGWLAAHFVSRL
jgi:phenylalanine-4-hydroxylase